MSRIQWHRDLLGERAAGRERTETIGSETHVSGYTHDAAGPLTDVTKDRTAVSHYGYDAEEQEPVDLGEHEVRRDKSCACEGGLAKDGIGRLGGADRRSWRGRSTRRYRRMRALGRRPLCGGWATKVSSR
jgi:hypothetical protein